MFIPSPTEEIYTSPLSSPVEIPNLPHTLLLKFSLRCIPFLFNPLKGNIGIFYNFAFKFLALLKKRLLLWRSLFYSGPK